jgi:hypothetical protein
MLWVTEVYVLVRPVLQATSLIIASGVIQRSEGVVSVLVQQVAQLA